MNVVMVLRFLPAGIMVEASAGDTILDAGLAHGVEIPHECGGNCSCTTCMVQVIRGAENLSKMENPEAFMLEGAPGRDSNSRLACQALLKGSVTVEIAGHLEAENDS